MKIDYNLIIICITIIINVHIIMNSLFNITTAKNAGIIMKNNFKDVLSEMDKIKKGSK